MKKIIAVLSMTAILAGSAVHADSTRDHIPAAKTAESSGFAWGVGLGAMAVIGAVVGIVVSNAAQIHSTSSQQ